MGAVPTELENYLLRRLLMTAAGPAASLGLGVLALWATFASRGESWKLLSYLATLGLFGFVINLLPAKGGGQHSDGARIYQLLSKNPGSQLELAFGMISSTAVSSLRPKDLDIQLIERAANVRATGREALLFKLYACTHFVDRGEIPDALRTLAEAETVYANSAAGLTEEVRVIAHEFFTFAHAFLRRDAEAARSWWDRTMAKEHSAYSVDSWKAYCSLLWIEQRRDEARSAWERGNALVQASPAVGAHEFDRDCFTWLRIELDAVSV